MFGNRYVLSEDMQKQVGLTEAMKGMIDFASGKIVPQKILSICENDGDTNANAYVEKEKKKGEYNLVIYKSRPTRWDYFMENPLGGGFGMTSYRSVKQAISAATRNVDFKGKKKIWVIETVFDYELGENGDYKVVKSYWMDI